MHYPYRRVLLPNQGVAGSPPPPPRPPPEENIFRLFRGRLLLSFPWAGLELGFCLVRQPPDRVRVDGGGRAPSRSRRRRARTGSSSGPITGSGHGLAMSPG